MPKSHDAKPRNKHRREKAVLNNIVPALARKKSARQTRRLRSRHYTASSYAAQNELSDWLRFHGLKWRHYEKACDTSSRERVPVATVLMSMAADAQQRRMAA
jgi:ABC-type branched-subunit amino acid transport system ATPase component